MAKKFREWKIEQGWLLPPSVLEFVPPGHLAHFVRNTVRDDLDLSELLESYVEERGYPPFHPVMMTALLLYAYTQGVYASRRIARGCEQRLDFMAVTGMQKPDFRTICKFRQRHLKALEGLFGQVVRLCQAAGLVKLGHVALDGTKVKANASKHKAMSYGRMKKAEEELKAEISKWFEEAGRIDAEEDELFGEDKRGDELPEWVADKQRRLAKIREAKAALEAEAKARQAAERPKSKRGQPPKIPPGTPPDKAQRNFTDPDSRIMKGRDGYIQGYNCQAVVDASSQVIVARGVTNSASDAHQLEPMVKQIKAVTGRQARELSADSGYCSEDNLRKLRRRHIEGYVATGKQLHGDASPTTQKYEPPGGSFRKKMATRLRIGSWRSRYRLRKQTVEPVFGQIRWPMGLRQLLLRGLDMVQGEWSLICTAFDLRKLAAAV
jgi:transposase